MINKSPKSRIAQVFAAAALLSAALGASAQTGGLLSVGDFELNAGTFDGDGRLYLQAGASLGAWTVGGTGVALVNSAPLALTGISMDLLGRDGSGSISQTFMAQAGTTYQLDWAMGGGSVGAELGVNLGTQTGDYFTARGSRSQQTLQWTATTTGLQTVSFARLGGKDDLIVDNVQLNAVSPVPEPESYALLLAGMGAVGFVARRRARA